MMIQLHPEIPVETPHGEGFALILIDYGPQWNTVWIVALKETREIKHYESTQIKLMKNHTFRIGT